MQKSGLNIRPWKSVNHEGHGEHEVGKKSQDKRFICYALPQTNSPREPLNKSARSAFQSEKPQIVRAVASDSSRGYGRVTSRARCGFSGETLSGRAFAGHPVRFDSLIWNNQTTLVEATPGDPAKTPSRPCRLVQRFLSWLARRGFVGAGGHSAGVGGASCADSRHESFSGGCSRPRCGRERNRPRRFPFMQLPGAAPSFG